jgi:hypothetical protein
VASALRSTTIGESNPTVRWNHDIATT